MMSIGQPPADQPIHGIRGAANSQCKNLHICGFDPRQLSFCRDYSPLHKGKSPHS